MSTDPSRFSNAATAGSLALLACALTCVLGWLWFGGQSTGSEAEAGMVSLADGMTILASEVSNEEIVCVLDSRQEQLMVYRLDAREGVQLLQRVSAPQLFQDAKARATGLK
ncbi:MAG: hypothetical protein ACOYN0_18130 [Phycisphaerales bacterium]